MTTLSAMTPPKCDWVVPSYSQSDTVRLNNYEVKGEVCSRNYNVYLTKCLVGDVKASDHATLDGSWAKTVKARNYNAIIKNQSCVEGEVEASDHVEVVASKVGSVKARNYNAVIDHAEVKGAVEASDHVKVNASQVGPVKARNYNVTITSNSEVSGAVQAGDYVTVQDSVVRGPVTANNYNATIERSKVFGFVKASDRVKMDNSIISGYVTARNYTVTGKESVIQGYIESSGKVDLNECKVAGSVTSTDDNVTLRGTTCGEVVSHGLPTLEKSSLASLTLYLSDHKPATLNLTDSKILGNLILRKEESGSREAGILGSFRGRISQICISDNGCQVTINNDSLTCGQGGFVLSGKLTFELKGYMDRYCKPGSAGMWNGQPARYQNGSIVLLQEPPATESSKKGSKEVTALKVNIVGGQIHGNIEHDFPVDVDVTQTNLGGQIRSIS